MDRLIHIQDLDIGYNNCTVVGKINVSIHTGELICLIGRNGEGKSTLIKTLCKLIPVISGNILIDGKHISKLNDNQFSNLISVVLTSKISIPNITVKEFVAFGRYPYTNWIGSLSARDNILINSAIDLCGIKDLEHRDFISLSDGEKQKVNIARAIAQNTPIVVLDEPTAHLDLVNNVEIFKLLKLLTKQHNKTIIFSTHYIELALQLADKLGVINQRELLFDSPKNIIEKGTIHQLFDEKLVKYNTLTNKFELLI